MPSPLLHEGSLYFLERFHGVLSNVDLKTGEVRYSEQRLEGMTNTYASPVGAAGRMYLIDRDGQLVARFEGCENIIDEGLASTFRSNRLPLEVNS